MQYHKLTTKKYLVFTKNVVKKVGSLAWEKPEAIRSKYESFKEDFGRSFAGVKSGQSKDMLEADDEEEKEGNNEINRKASTSSHLDKFCLYFERNYLPLMEKGILNYKKIDQKYRSNSVLEGYHSQLQQSLTKKPNWIVFIKVLQEQEKSVREEILQQESEGKIWKHGKRYGVPFFPDNLKTKISALQTEFQRNAVKQNANLSKDIYGKREKMPSLFLLKFSRLIIITKMKIVLAIILIKR